MDKTDWNHTDVRRTALKEITYTIPYSHEYELPNYIINQCPSEQVLFFDIETTGFIAQNTTLYLIGALYYRKNEVHIIQWLNEDGHFEKEIISTFNEFSKKFTHLIHFNGTGFDLPYLRRKASLLNIPFTIDDKMKQIDIYKEIKSYKNILHLENLKQITIEQYLGIQRKDTYSGGDLIPIYQRYVATGSPEYEKILLLHNYDDLLGMPKVSAVLNYCAFFQNPDIKNVKIEISEQKNESLTSINQTLQVYFDISSRQSLHTRVLYDYHGIYLNIMETKGYLSIPIIKDTLLHFFSDYKNYYYLPQEDMAIHKSVATYVDPVNRIKATKNNCYIKKQDSFIPCFHEQQGLDSFSKTPKDKEQYISQNNLLTSDISVRKKYISHIIQAMK